MSKTGLSGQEWRKFEKGRDLKDGTLVKALGEMENAVTSAVEGACAREYPADVQENEEECHSEPQDASATPSADADISSTESVEAGAAAASGASLRFNGRLATRLLYACARSELEAPSPEPPAPKGSVPKRLRQARRTRRC